jgi:hypothetical protein
MGMLADPRLRIRRTFIDRQIGLFVVVALASLAVNPGRVSAVSPVLYKAVALYAGMILLVYLIASIAVDTDTVLLVMKVIVVGGAVLAVTGIVESRTDNNLFDNLDQQLPFLEINNVYEQGFLPRGQRAHASSVHSIEFGALLLMLVPLALVLAAATRQARWWLAAAILTVGMTASLSRTPVLMMGGALLAGYLARSKEIKKLLPLVVPLVVIIHFAVPGTLGPLARSFFPQEGLIAQQNTRAGSGRIASIEPALQEELATNPLLGVGFRTRVTSPEGTSVAVNAIILDNQWLGILVETGIVGAFVLLWLFLRFVRRCIRLASHDYTTRGWLLAGLGSSVAAYAVGMLTFDAFAFTQVTFLLFVLLGLGAALVNQASEPQPPPPRLAAVPSPD